ncbi:ATPase [Flagellimonas okinawensis]|uniref:ATPase n=1 Tax=Flagellimonas okinawensis TaxID=3031324 RepID=A0ABT5XTD0_9FLAO|nr:ATPase [[Muricauda] okinawensis]MDF0709047.1 ATPase [[Muricauda] okinawensis]
MKLNHPHIITEGARTYHIGKLEGTKVTYDFERILEYLQVKGKMMFGERFNIHEEDMDTLLVLCAYLTRDYDRCKKYGIEPLRGLLLTGPVGCGKIGLIRLLRFLVPCQRPYIVIPTRNVVFGFNHLGHKTIEDFGNGQFFCFDDLGAEPNGWHNGKECNVLGKVLLSRYALFVKHHVRTHCTTDLNVGELEERYGKRVLGRMRRMFNLVAFDKKNRAESRFYRNLQGKMGMGHRGSERQVIGRPNHTSVGIL